MASRMGVAKSGRARIQRDRTVQRVLKVMCRMCQSRNKMYASATNGHAKIKRIDSKAYAETVRYAAHRFFHWSIFWDACNATVHVRRFSILYRSPPLHLIQKIISDFRHNFFLSLQRSNFASIRNTHQSELGNSCPWCDGHRWNHYMRAYSKIHRKT